MTNASTAKDPRPHVVIIGGGFGGLYAAMNLKRAAVRVTLIDKNNYHCFQPLLYQVATGGLSPANIAIPLRAIIGRQKNVTIQMASVRSVDPQQQIVHLDDDTELSYDWCIVASGAQTNWFGKKAEWAMHAPGLKSLEDALYLRRQVFSAFEKSERYPEQSPVFVVVGGGPTGIEMAGAIAELAHSTLVKDFKHTDTRKAKIILIEAGHMLLNSFPERLQKRAQRDLEKLGVEVLLQHSVQSVADNHIIFQKPNSEESRLDCNLLVWAAGVTGSPIGTALADASGHPLQRGARVFVDEYCQLPGYKHTFIIGDLAYFRDRKNHPDLAEEDVPALPGVAPVAMQQGRYVAKFIKSALRNKTAKGFKYWDKGSMATIGRNKAVAVSAGIQMTGLIAWLAWLFVHILYLNCSQNRLLVLLQWSWAYFTYNRNARLITQAVNPEDKSSKPSG